MIQIDYEKWLTLYELCEEDNQCELCEGTGKEKCINCDGSGECECYHCGTKHRCGTCSGFGFTICEGCGGFGHTLQRQYKKQLSREADKAIVWGMK